MADVRPHVTIYTDGACRGNPGPGGFGVVLLFGDHRRELSDGYRLTTNNRMEVLAAIAALEALNRPCRVALHTDSDYLINGAGSAERWCRNGWRLNPPKTKKAANRDLWIRLLGMRELHEVDFHWVRGHAGVTENERCDQLAVQAAAGDDLKIDEVYENENPGQTSLSEKSRPPEMPRSDVKITQEGQPCRNCGTAVVRQTPRRRKLKPGQRYYFAYYFACPACRAMYMVEEAKRRYCQKLCFLE